MLQPKRLEKYNQSFNHLFHFTIISENTSYRKKNWIQLAMDTVPWKVLMVAVTSFRILSGNYLTS
jgi:hypothetical protein